LDQLGQLLQMPLALLIALEYPQHRVLLEHRDHQGNLQVLGILWIHPFQVFLISQEPLVVQVLLETRVALKRQVNQVVRMLQEFQ